MVKVLDPDGIIIGVFESEADVPKHIWNRTHSYCYRRRDCSIVEVTHPIEKARLLPSLQAGEQDLPQREQP